MPFGSGPLIRQTLVQAQPWQRYAIAIAMVAGGVVLVLLGHIGGGLLAVGGVVLLWRMARYRVHRLQKARRAPGREGP